MVKTEKMKTHVIFPIELIEAIDKSVGGRKRSKFIVEAAKEKLEEIKFRQALEATAGCWKDENHPDLRTQKDIRIYLKKTREKTEQRIKRLSE
ncbi:MAG: hypothetical protein EPN94_11515 [Nitrospirae bacterium]|nr:MAG: hypothetical protein EPN94_11515 [Nitrospirota bacterium]